jgi:hypothetical protein
VAELSGVSLRPATATDVPRLTELVRAAYAHYIPRLGGPPRPMYCGEIVGLAVLGVDDEGCFVDNVAVAPSHQGIGVGNFTPAFPHDQRPFEERTVPTPDGPRRYDEQPFWISHASLSGLSAVSAPIGRTACGLPVGAQIIGPIYEDDTAITFAELAVGVVGGYEPPPA